MAAAAWFETRGAMDKMPDRRVQVVAEQSGDSARASSDGTGENGAPQPPDFSLLDALYHPGETTPMHSVIAAAATERVREIGGSLSEAEMDAVLAEAGWPVELWGQAKAVAWCESKWSPYAVGDGGNSLGAFQLWYGWFAPAGFSAEQAFDPVVNARVAWATYQYDLGRGYAPWKQWTCKP